MKPFFSICTPFNCWNEERRNQFYRALKSIQNQTFKDFEWIIVNDGSTLEFEVPKSKWLKVINKEHGERVIAFKMFNFGAKYIYKDGEVTYREPFTPAILDVGHEVFCGGNIVSGTFIWHRSVYEDLGAYPPDVVKDIDCTEINYGGVRDLHMNTPFDFSAYYQVKYPELRQFFMVDFEGEPNKIIKELGNPWGQDFGIWYTYTRKYHSKPIKEYLYIVHPKS